MTLSPGAKTVLIVGGIAVILLFVMSRQPVRAGASTTKDASTAGAFFQFGTAVTNLVGKVIGPSNDGSGPVVDGPEDEYTGPGGYDTSSFRV